MGYAVLFGYIKNNKTIILKYIGVLVILTLLVITQIITQCNITNKL